MYTCCGFGSIECGEPSPKSHSKRIESAGSSSLEGSLSQGYPVDPDPAVIGWRRIFGGIGAKGDHQVIVESDSGPGPASDPGRSLRHAKISARNLLGFRGTVTPLRQSTVADEAAYESDEALAG